MRLIPRLGLRKTTTPRRPAATRLRLLPLEDRTVPNAFTVSNNHDAGAGSLRQAVLDANAHPGADAIVFAHSVHQITLTGGELGISDDLTVLGPGSEKLSVSGNDASRVFDIQSGTVSISGMSVVHGRADKTAAGVAGAGGGILNQANLTLDDVVVAASRAIGDKSVTVAVGGYFFTGAGLGGGVGNLGTLSATDCAFVRNQAIGGDGSVGPNFTQSGGLTFPGLAVGGGLWNLVSTASVTDSLIAGNVAQGGSNCGGTFAGLGGGAGIYNDASLTVTGSAIVGNSALGGDNNSGDFHTGHGFGGAIVSGSVAALFGLRSSSLVVSRSAIDCNSAVGGDGNSVTLPPAFVSGVDGPGDGLGGGVLVFQGTATFANTQLRHNLAAGGDSGSSANGSRGIGGGLFFLDYVGGVTASVSDSGIDHNAAIGGGGGDALGGGIAAGTFGAAFSGPGTLTVSHSEVDHNVAHGGQGGDGLGGGVFNDAGSALTLTADAITHNRAEGGAGGDGIGGGIYNLGTLAVDGLTIIRHNHASTSNDNIFP